jgi:hypothetical protein
MTTPATNTDASRVLRLVAWLDLGWNQGSDGNSLGGEGDAAGSVSLCTVDLRPLIGPIHPEKCR